MNSFKFTERDIYEILRGTQMAGQEYLPGINFVFAIKHNNAGKLNSHLFLFRGICEYLQPKYVTLIDIGTMPKNGAINKLVKHLDSNVEIGGACGTIDVEIPPKLCGMEFLLVYSQVYEYKISNYLDKAA